MDVEPKHLIPIDRMWERAARAKEDSDTAFFHDLLNLGEFLVKVVTLAMVASVVDGRERHQYRLRWSLVRADGIGGWVRVLDDVLAGTPNQDLLDDARPDHRELTQAFRATDRAWQVSAVTVLEQACREAGLDGDALPPKFALRHWFMRFPALRNRTRGHGATTGARCSAAVPALERSLEVMTERLSVLNRPWAYLHQNLSGKYRVIPLSAAVSPLDHLKRDKHHTLPDGVYIHVGEPRRVELMESDASLSDFWVPNGKHRDRRFELLSYISDDVREADGGAYEVPPEQLPESQTGASPELDVVGESFTDLPPPLRDHVTRSHIEEELRSVLRDDRHPVVTLAGGGGFGKTSVALRVLRDIAESGEFFAIPWFSARDVDLLEEGPRLVQTQVKTVPEIVAEFTRRMNPVDAASSTFDPTSYMTDMVSDRDTTEPLLLVFDNFETIRNPVDVFMWLSNAVRLPNKILITTRFRDFKGDYPVPVKGMLEDEFQELVKRTATRLKIQHLLNTQYVRELYEECDGHPYIAKILLGEVAVKGEPAKVERVMASKEDILDALFERSFGFLPVFAQRLFLTLCNWRSFVPRLALEAVLTRPSNEPIDVPRAIELLERSSMIELSVSEVDSQEWLSVPLAAHLFGHRKLQVSPMKDSVASDARVLQAFGAATDISHGVEPRVRALVRRIAELVEDGDEVGELAHVLEYVARKYPRAWLDVARLASEQGEARDDLPDSIEAVTRYLERQPDDVSAWRFRAELAAAKHDPELEMYAWMELALRDTAEYRDVVHAARRFNHLLAAGTWIVETTSRKEKASQLRGAMLERIEEADASGCATIAWLCLHLRDADAAREYVERGLRLDGANEHCLNLAHKLGITTLDDGPS